MRDDFRCHVFTSSACLRPHLSQMLHFVQHDNAHFFRRFFNMSHVYIESWRAIQKKIWRLEKVAISSELLMRLELTTSSLPRKCSTTELQQHSHALFRKRVCKSNQQFSIRQIFGGHIIDFPAASIRKSAKTAIFPPKWLPIQVLLRPRSCVAFQSGRTRSVRRALQPYMTHRVWQSPPSRDCR